MSSHPFVRRPFIPASAALALALLASPLHAQRPTPTEVSPVQAPAQAGKPAWLTDVSLSDKVSYDDNVLLVSGLGLPRQSSWVNDLTFRAGVDLAPVLSAGPLVQSLAIAYQPEWVDFKDASAWDYLAHRVFLTAKGKDGAWSYSVDDQFLYNDGNKTAETYAENQLSGTAANQNDKYRNKFSHTPVRERLNSIQDRYTVSLRYDTAHAFIRPISQLIYDNINTYLFNTSAAPYKGYQDYVDRWDINAGADFGLKVSPSFALFVGYRDGFQHQDRFDPTINSDQHYSSSHYQRALLGAEGNVGKWLTLKFTIGPDFRDYNPNTPIDNLHTTRYYGEATVTANLSASQSLSLRYLNWLNTSSTGVVPYGEDYYWFTYHLKATKQLGLDLGFRYAESNYTIGNDTSGSAPSNRDDDDLTYSVGLSYAVTPQLSVTVGYVFDDGHNLLHNLPATLAPAYRDFTHNVSSVGLAYKF